jgi:hypothetical protein
LARVAVAQVFSSEEKGKRLFKEAKVNSKKTQAKRRPVAVGISHTQKRKRKQRSFYYLKLCVALTKKSYFSSSPSVASYFVSCALRQRQREMGYALVTDVAWLEIIQGGRACQPSARSPQSSISLKEEENFS